MNCWRTRQLLAAFQDGELSPSEASLVEEHTASCPDCSAAMEQLEALPPFELPRLDEDVEQELWQRMDSALDQAWEDQKRRPNEGVVRTTVVAVQRWLRSGRVAVPVPVAAAYLALIMGLTGWTLYNHYEIQDLSAALRGLPEESAVNGPMRRLASPGPAAFTASVSLPLERAADDGEDPTDSSDREDPTPLAVPVYDSTGAIIYTVDHGYPIEY
jgi:hypothetical protein